MRDNVGDVTHMPRQHGLPIKPKLHDEVVPVAVALVKFTMARGAGIYNGAYRRPCT